MKRSFILSILLIVGLTCSQSKAQLKILEGNEISFGRIYQTGEKVHAIITIKNSGKEEITIDHINTSCGCTAAMISDSSLDPGKQAQIKIEFNPTGYMGEVTKYIYISNSDLKNQLITVKLTGYVAYALQPTPNAVMFNGIKIGVPDSSSITLSNTSDEEFVISQIETPDSEITYKLDKDELKPGEFTDLHLYLNPKEQREITGFIKILTTSKLQPVLQVRVFEGSIFR